VRPTTYDGFLFLYPIEPPWIRHGQDNKRLKIGVERVKLAVDGAKLLMGLGVRDVDSLRLQFCFYGHTKLNSDRLDA
jgi:hypothetical protein